MKLIEFITKHEGESVSSAYLTFGKHYDSLDRKGVHQGIYISFVIPAIKMTRESWDLSGRVTGWFGYRITIGYYVGRSGKIHPYMPMYWDLLKQISIVTREQMANEKT